MFARIWDAPVRLFHWLLVALLAFSWWSGEQHEMEWHRLSGYGILALLIFRIYWGFVGGRTARFAQFLRGPRAAFAYAKSIAKGPYAAAPGHNPIGGWSVMLMLATLAAMVVAGLFAVDVDGLESGPLADYVSFDQGRAAANIHGFVFNLLLALVALHVLAILFYLVRLRHNLIGPMIHGRRAVSGNDPVEDLRASPSKAMLGIVIAGICTYVIAQGFRL
ncbi:Ni/Fe-hydrogenase 1 b-type cytochrome subunit [Sphingomonas oleivorans]|uniref:Ni/Fe-hydrogenase 1 b-type cytochrome subunit n=1 Tax=Sphingomonas oleivorans TaxID=1735121 RepID=A0A2T5G0S3_9SPHN|nr:cytochrome b/b6 domain-containing protein [Sphingomonas oleivorans]PTQ12755.1 Ni/Fe-hydrogenase 1 b-type cytochrome subunit [Sphingomonas oleivorans]